MADDNKDASTVDEGSEPQVTFNVKSSSEGKYVVTVPLSMTVADLKQKLSTPEYATLPPERQRLIYSGRVLKDPDTLSAVKIKDGNTVHLVKGAESNQRQNPTNQGGSAVPAAAGQPATNVPSNIAAGTGAGNPLAQLTGARYAGFHGLPGMDMFGADGGMGAPPNPDQMIRMLEDPNFAQQMNEAMNNPAVIDMLRNNPMIRDNPIARQAIENPELRRMMMNPEMIRMQMQMQRAMGGGGDSDGSGFAMPGVTDTTPQGQENATAERGASDPASQTNAAGNAAPNAQNPFGGQGGANPFAALFGGAGGIPGAQQGGNTGDPTQNAQQQPPNPFASLLGQPQGGQTSPFAQAAQQLMQNPQMMQQMMQTFGGGNGMGGEAGGFNPFAALGGLGSPEPQGPPDNRPPEERYAEQLRQLNDMGFYEFERNVQALRRSGGSVQGAVEFLLSG
ncbi:hypothetical protein K431DRAFT_305853 [Polychaeton citri CBS 116435]|uniref:Ubiquitin-domain-containing protein n=1 Tax=Polychaeton citri CBS 116435 TaxID=1314669 RepID=A0A9P4Q382_9PEZI|nr:hypothetical protein K431DRAFT_305853 [Polychaeton citri CBS 116435]